MVKSEQTKQDRKEKASSGMSIKKILESPIQVIFLLVTIISLFTLVPFTLAGIRCIQKGMKDKPDNYEFPALKDFKITLISAVGFAIAKQICDFLFYPLMLTICKEQKDLKIRDMRSKKGAASLYKCLYFLSVSIWGYMILKDQPWFPTYLGGKGDIAKTFTGYPYTVIDQKVKDYILVTQGYHLASLIIHFLSERRNDFVEMTLHHIVTIYLYSGCYMINCIDIGAVIAFLHDLADVTTSLTKIFSESIYKKTTIVGFISNMLIWIYTRNLILPYLIFNIVFRIPHLDFLGEKIIRPYFAYLLTCLATLHIYWMLMMFKLLKIYLKTDSTEDIQNKIQSNQEKKKE